MLHFKAKMH